jgi:phosphoglycerate dehydrogenase-like enzyme
MRAEKRRAGIVNQLAARHLPLEAGMSEKKFTVGFSRDFLDEQGRLIFPDIGLSLLEAEPNLTYRFFETLNPEYTPDQLAGLDVLITLKPRVTADSLREADRLCAIGRCGVGYDNVDLAACTDRDIALYITPAGVVRPMASSIVLLVLALSLNLVLKDRMMREGRWIESTRKLGREPRGRVIGTIGLGNIACEAVRLLRNFDPHRVIAFDPYADISRAKELGVELMSLDEVLHISDYVLINCPLNAETHGLIGAREIALMKPTTVLINTARGTIVNQAALIDALENWRIAGAALDVYEREPLEPDSPLLKLDNVVLTSHSIGWTEELFRDMGRIDCQGALAVMRGEVPQSVVNREVLNRPGFQNKLAGHARRFSGREALTR